MIRRWSHLNSINSLFIQTDGFFFFLKKRNKFVNFKKSVSLKRFNKKYTKFKRKSLTKIKHLKNWFIYHNVFKFWSHSYLFLKHYYKFQFIQNIFINNNSFYNFNFLINLNPNIFYNWNFLFFNLRKKSNFYFNSFFILKKKSKSFFTKSICWFNDEITKTPLNLPFHSIYENKLYPYWAFLENKNFNLNNLILLNYSIIKKKLIFYYKLIVIISLFK